MLLYLCFLSGVTKYVLISVFFFLFGFLASHMIMVQNTLLYAGLSFNIRSFLIPIRLYIVLYSHHERGVRREA